MIGWEFVRLYLYTTTKCPFNCKHCFIGEERKKLNPIHIDLRLVQQFLDDFVTNKTKSINLTGDGLPLAHPQFMEIVKLCKVKVGNVSVNTRGHIPGNILNELKIYDVVVYYSVDWFGLNNDKWCGVKNLWKIQTNTIMKMAKLGMKFAIRTTLMRHNLSDCIQLINLVGSLRARGVDVVFECMPYLPYHTVENTPTREQVKHLTLLCLERPYCRMMIPGWTCIYPDFRDRASRWWHTQKRLCEAGRPYGRIALKETGEILPCPFEQQVVGRYKLKYGEYVIDKRELFANLEEYLDLLPLPPSCENCHYKEECGGGCRIYQALTGDQKNCPIPDLF